MRPLLLVPLLLAACSQERPPCPYTGPADFAPSAGCLAVVHGRVLLVEDHQGKMSPPGGSALAGESAQCAAHRETLEETGLGLLPGRLLQVFDTGFHLYQCDIHPGSGQFDPDRVEVRRGLWLSLEDFDTVQWRYPGQGAVLHTLVTTPPPEEPHY